MRLGKSKVLASLALCLLLSSSPLLASSPPAATSTTKLQHLIFIIQENRSFDNYFGVYPGANGLSNAPVCCPTSLAGASQEMTPPYHLDVTQPIMIVGDELPPGEMYPDANDSFAPAASSGNDVLPFLIPSEAASSDLNHAWRAAFTDWNYGKMNGFIVGQKNNATMGYFDRTDIPNYYDYASNFVLDDNFFSSMMGPSFPNHLYVASGSAGDGALANPNNYGWIVNGSVIDNPPQSGGDVQLSPSVVLSLGWAATAQQLSQHQVSWKWYTGSTNATAASYWDVLPVFSYFQQHPQELKQNVVGTESFVGSVKNGTLPSVSWIIPGNKWAPPIAPFDSKPAIRSCGTSEHPPVRPDCGMDYVSYLVNSVMNSQYWQSTAIVVTWDDYGGFYDHVAPPLTTADGEGFRVPTLVISPYAKPATSTTRPTSSAPSSASSKATSVSHPLALGTRLASEGTT